MTFGTLERLSFGVSRQVNQGKSTSWGDRGLLVPGCVCGRVCSHICSHICSVHNVGSLVRGKQNVDSVKTQ